VTTPAAFTNALGRAGTVGRYWLEIEGWPTAYGNFSVGSTFFDSRTNTRERFAEVRNALPVIQGDGGDVVVPQLAAQELDHVEGRTSLGSLTIAVADTDGTLSALTAGWRLTGPGTYEDGLYLDGRLTASATDIVVSYVGDATGWPSSGVAYFTNEAARYASVGSGSFSGIVRGAYRSRIEAHAGGGAAGGGALLTPYPRYLNGRRVWLWWGLDATTATDAVLLFGGTIHRPHWEQRGQVLVLECDDQQADIKRAIFTDINSWLESTDGEQPTGTLDPDTATLAMSNARFNSPSYEKARRIYAHVGQNAFVLLTRRPTGVFDVDAGAAGSTQPYTRFDDGAEFAVRARRVLPVFPCVLVRKQIANSPQEVTRFFAGFRATRLHPLEAVLQVLLSTGTAVNNGVGFGPAVGANGRWDTLPAEWSLGLAPADVDVSGIEALIRQTSDYGINLPVLAPVEDAREWMIRELLQPFGFYFRPTWGGKLGVGWLREPTADEIAAAPTITQADLALDGDGQPLQLDGPDFDMAAVVKGVQLTAAFSWLDGDERPGAPITLATTLGEGATSPFPGARVIEIESRGLHVDPPRFIGSALRFKPEGSSAPQVLSRVLAGYLSRFSRPPAMFRLALDMSAKALTLNAGDLVRLTLDNVPSVRAGARGLSGAVCEVASKAVDLVRGTVSVTLAQSGLGASLSRFVAPSCIVTGLSSATLTVEEHEFTDPTGDFSDTHPFHAGDKVRIYRANLAARFGPYEVASKTDSTLVLTASPAGYTREAGDVVMPADFSECTASQRGRFAFCADGDHALGGGVANGFA
jgi:hypothetical protein